MLISLLGKEKSDGMGYEAKKRERLVGAYKKGEVEGAKLQTKEKEKAGKK